MKSQPACTLVTGASSGIGRAIAERLARSHRLILHGRDNGRLEDTRSACARPESHLLWTHDFRQVAQVAPALTELLAGQGMAVDGFVHCAGAVHVLSARSARLEAVLESLNVNYVAAQQIIATLLKKRVNPGRLRSVVVISSIWSQFGARGHSLYCASKAALDGMVRALAVELAPWKIRVNALCPGPVNTPLLQELFAKDAERAARRLVHIPMGRFAEPEEIAAAACFLASDDASFITASTFLVDGGINAAYVTPL